MSTSPSDLTTNANSSATERKSDRKTKRRLVSFGKFIYNKKDRTICHRTCLLIAFYVVFLGMLFGLFFGLLALILNSLMKNKSVSLFAKTDLMSDPSPALSVYPRLATSTTPIIWYTRKGTPNDYLIHPDLYVQHIDKLLQRYDEIEPKRYVDCEKAFPRDGQYCLFSRSDLGACGESRTEYGYGKDTPCVFLKLNMIENWKPSRKRKKMFRARDGREGKLSKNNVTIIDGFPVFQFEMITVNCDGITSFDEQHMGKISYFPRSGFREYFFPYDGSIDYLRPLIGLKFDNLTRGLVIGIKCTVKDIENMKNPHLHTTSFYLYIDRD